MNLAKFTLTLYVSFVLIFYIWGEWQIYENGMQSDFYGITHATGLLLLLVLSVIGVAIGLARGAGKPACLYGVVALGITLTISYPDVGDYFRMKPLALLFRIHPSFCPQHRMIGRGAYICQRYEIIIAYSPIDQEQWLIVDSYGELKGKPASWSNQIKRGFFSPDIKEAPAELACKYSKSTRLAMGVYWVRGRCWGDDN